MYKYLLDILAISLKLPQPDVAQHYTAQTNAYICALFQIHSVILSLPPLIYIRYGISFRVFLFYLYTTKFCLHKMYFYVMDS